MTPVWADSLTFGPLIAMLERNDEHETEQDLRGREKGAPIGAKESKAPLKGYMDPTS